MGFRKRPSSTKAVPYLSHDFVIENHGDIVTCFCMVFVVGLMFQTTAPLASSFITPKYNMTEMDNSSEIPVQFTYGPKDACLVLFYSLAAIIFHALIQEYVLDKLIKKVRLSKTKANKFNESGQFLAFYLVSIAWTVTLFRDEGFFQSLNFLWSGYPHVGLTFLTKLFFIIQLSYWVHVFPELYFQKVKKEDMSAKIFFAIVNFLVCGSIYFLNFTRIGLTLLTIEYAVSSLFHASRLLHFSDKKHLSEIGFKAFNILFVLSRFISIILSMLTFWFGLKSTSIEQINFAEGNFNTPFVRMACLTFIIGVQILTLWNFVLFHFKRIRENTPTIVKTTRIQAKKTKAKKSSDSELSSSNLDEETRKSK